MTVCIASICQDDGAARIMLCADGRLSHSWAGSSDENVKVQNVGHGWTSMLSSDEWSHAVALREYFSANWTKFASPSTKEEAYESARTIGSDFLKSPFHSKRASTQMLLSGFIGEAPMILELKIERSKVSVERSDSFLAIGSGAPIATVFLNQRDCSPTGNMERTAYILYEAKRCSQKDPNVGPGTILGAIMPPPPSGIATNESWVTQFNEIGIRHLEALYQRLGLQRIPALDEFTPEFFESPK